MSDFLPDVDILIAGAGPVGLFLANECTRRGLRWRLVEARSGQSEHSKALAIFPRTLEILDMAGLVAPFLQAANRVTSVAVITHGRMLARMQFAPEETPYAFVAMVPQDVTERLLVDELHRRGALVEYDTEFVSASQHSDYVNVTLNKRGRRSNVTASFVVGCDGAHSSVRHSIQMPFEGGEYSELYILADVRSNESLPADQLQLCPSESGPFAIFPMSATRRRIIATIERPEGDAPSLALVQKIAAERGPAGFEAQALRWGIYFRTHHRHVSRLRSGRIFIAGDAAHIHSPFGGQGMNTGLHDIWNLAWKLDLALRGRAGDDLLESYTAERIPVIKSVIETTDLLTKALGTPNKFAQVLRDAAIPMVSRLVPFQHAFVQRLSELGIAYPGSRIVEGAGNRYFDDSLRGGDRIRSRFLLLYDHGADTDVKDAVHHFVRSFAHVLESRPGRYDRLTLLRPDGYVAYSASRATERAFAEIRALLERQTASNAPEISYHYHQAHA